MKTKSKLNETQMRQGDVMLVRVDRLPKNLKTVARENGRIVLAHGEVTGHSHHVKNRMAEFFEDAADEGQRYLHAPVACQLQHEEHGTIAIPAGDYRIVRQREYAPEAIRNVAD